jgi:3-oxoacyl-[acyl-carrier protein] reductase
LPFYGFIHFFYMHLSLNGKIALIGGGSEGIGLASARELALLGADCILVSRSQEKLEKALASLDATQGQQHQYLSADLGNAEDLTHLLDRLASLPAVEVFVNNSGGPPGGPVLNASPESFLKAFTQHLLAAQQLVSYSLFNFI